MEFKKGNIVTALFFILIGLWYLAQELVPGMKAVLYGSRLWPLQILVIAGIFAFIALITWTPGLWIPASIIGGVGGILYYQSITHTYYTWSYAWTLIPGFVAVGLALFGVFGRKPRVLFAAGINLLVSAMLFGIFSTAFGPTFLSGIIWPAALILLGLVVLFRPRRRAN